MVGVKDSDGRPGRHGPPHGAGAGRLRGLLRRRRADACPLLAVGAVGLVSVASHWVGRELARHGRRRSWQGRRRGGAGAANAGCSSPSTFESTEQFPNPLPAKAACRALGLAVGQCRLPMGVAPPELDGEARVILQLSASRASHGWPDRLSRRQAGPRRLPRAGWARSAATAPASRWTGGIVVLDCGIMFPDPDMPGVDLVLPDFTYLHENADRVDGVVLTHGHEDHTGGLAFLLRDLELPIYGSELTLGPGPATGSTRRAWPGAPATSRSPTASGGGSAPCEVEFIPVTHSVPNAFAIAFHTPQGVVLHSGDFKLDLQPVDGRRTDLARIGALAPERGDPAAPVGLDQRRGARLHRLGVHGGGDHAPGLRRPARPAGHRGLLRQPHPPGPAGRRRRRGQRPPGGHPRAAPWARTWSWRSRLGILSVPDGTLVDIEDVDELPAG